MPTGDFIGPTWDLLDAWPGTGGPLPAYGGVLVGVETAPVLVPESYGENFFRIPVKTMLGLYGRVREWTFAGSGTWFNEGLDPIPFSFDLTLYTEGYYKNATPVVDERELALVTGWFGGAPPDGTYLRFGWSWNDAPALANEFGVPDAVESVTIRPPEGLIETGATGSSPGGVRIGKWAPEDDFIVTATLPATLGGSFDGTGCTGWTFQLGAPPVADIFGGGTAGYITGSGTLVPSRFWGHDRGDGGGPDFDEGTGAFLRTPRGIGGI